MSDVKVGGNYKLKNDNYISWGIAKGDVVTCVWMQNSQAQFKLKDNPAGQQLQIPVSHLDFWLRSKDDIEKDIEEAKDKIAESEAKLKWMAATNNEEFNDDEFKVWHTLTIIEDLNLSKADRAKAIAKLIGK